MIELIEEAEYKDKWFTADDMYPLQVCVTEDGTVVMRTASSRKLEIMDLTSPCEDACWTDVACFQVRSLRPGETYTLKLS